MGDAILIVNDAQLTVASPDTVLADSPGYATVHEGQLVLGSQAYAHARLNPTQTHSSFWQELNQEALPAGSSTVARHADLVFAHLQAIWAEAQEQGDLSRVALVVAGDLNRSQLGLLLGICKQVGIPVQSLVQDALLAPQDGHEGQVAYLDLHLHRSILTPLRQSEELVVDAPSVDRKLGLARFHEAFADAVADCFVRNTRFDPMHSARTEQEIYSSLAQTIAPLRDEITAPLNIEHGDTAYATELRRENLFASAGSLYDRLIKQITSAQKSGEPLTVIASPRIMALPGLGDLIQTQDNVSLREADPLTMARTAISMKALDSSDSKLKLLTRRPWQTTRPAAAPAQPQATGRLPTHLLMDAKGVAIGTEPLIVGTGESADGRCLTVSARYPGVSRQHFTLRRIGQQVFLEDLSRYGTFLNGQRVQGRTEVSMGDHIRIGNPGAELTLICVEDG